MEDAHLIKKQIRWRGSRRSLKEMDLWIGGFVAHELDHLSATELVDLAALLDRSDKDLWEWLNNEVEPPAAFNTPLLAKLKNFSKSP